MPETPMTRYARTVQVLTEVMEERAAQDRTWGEQNHPLHTPEENEGMQLLAGQTYARVEADLKYLFSQGARSGSLILLEEVMEALAARDLVNARTELVQVAAVAVMLVEGIDRARARGTTAVDRRGNVRPCDVVASSLVTGDGTRRYPVAGGDDEHPRGYSADHILVDDVPGPDEDFDRERALYFTTPTPHTPVCGADGCTDAYCPGGKACVVQTAAHGRDGAMTTFRHPHQAGRLHGICRCGEGKDAPVHDTGGE